MPSRAPSSIPYPTLNRPRPAAHGASRLAAAPAPVMLHAFGCGLTGVDDCALCGCLWQAMVILDETITQNNDLQLKWNM